MTANVSYGTRAGITIDLDNLSDGAYRQSASISNTTEKAIDCLVGGKIRSGSVAPTDGTTITVFAYGRNRTGGFTAGCSGSDAAYTADGEEDELMFLTAITVDTTTDQDYEFGPVSLAAAFGGVVPDDWGIVVLNEIGQALDNASPTQHDIDYLPIHYIDE